MENSNSKTGSGSAATKALAAVGFVVLIVVGMALAVYAARFVPAALSRIGASVGSVFERDAQPGDGDLVVVPPQDTVPFPDEPAAPATSTPVVVGESPVTVTPSGTPGYVAPAPYAPGYSAHPGSYGPRPAYYGGSQTVTTVPVTPRYYGEPDLVIENVVTGYLETSDTDSFRASREVPDGERGAVRFTIANRGTDLVDDDFEFEVEIPTETDYTYDGRVTRDLRPGERITYTLGFDQPDAGDDKDITIEIDSDDDIDESDERNNERTVEVDIDD